MTEIYKNYMQILEHDQKNSDFSAYNDKHLAEMVKENLSNAANQEEFYKKLVELKNEQKKTLIYLEELYNQKQTLRDEIKKSEVNLNDIKSITYPFPKGENYKFNLNTISAYEVRPFSQIEETNEFKKVESKPPLPKYNTVTFQNTVNIAHKQNDNDDFEHEIHEDINDDLKRIEKIWENFKVDDELNANKKSLDFNRKFERIVKKDIRNSKVRQSQVEWVPRVTIPEPFSMTIREQIKSEKKKLVAREMQDEREKRIEAELRESHKKFRAQPVPAHVMIPLYEKLKHEEELRKIKLQKMSKEYLEKVSRPFNLTETKKKEIVKERRHSFSEGQTEFNAQPLPEFYFNEELDEKMKESELYKQLKNQMRALELLKQSKLPNNMQLQEEKKRLEQERAKIYVKEMRKLQKKVDQSLKKRANSASQVKSRKSHDVPDFDSLYKKFVIEMETKKSANRKETKQEPFVLLTENRTRPRGEEKPTIKRANSTSRLNKSLSVSMDAFPIKYNESQKLRESVTKEKINEMVRKELQKEHIEKIKKLKEKKLHSQIQDKINYDPKEIDKNFERQTRKLRLEQKAKEEEYEKEIGNMYKSVEARKLQFEKLEEDNIRRAMEKKYKDVLKRAGIDEKEIHNGSKSSVKVASSIVHEEYDTDWINQ